jgi:hypothetical protein
VCERERERERERESTSSRQVGSDEYWLLIDCRCGSRDMSCVGSSTTEIKFRDKTRTYLELVGALDALEHEEGLAAAEVDLNRVEMPGDKLRREGLYLFLHFV